MFKRALKMKSILRSLAPPLLLTSLKKATSRRPKYRTYLDAAAACPKDAYQHRELVNVVVDKNIAFKQTLSTKNVLEFSDIRTLIGLGLSKTGYSLNVIDFGGGGGYHYTVAAAALGGLTDLKWNVVETTAMVNESRRLANDRLKFFDNIAEAANDLPSVDLVFTSSALQYCPNPLAFLKQLIDVNAKHLYITRTPFSNGDDDIFSTQVSNLSANGPGPLPSGYVDKKITYPISYISQSKVEAALNEHYHIQFKTLEDQAIHLVGNTEIDMYGYFCVLKKLVRDNSGLRS